MSQFVPAVVNPRERFVVMGRCFINLSWHIITLNLKEWKTQIKWRKNQDKMKYKVTPQHKMICFITQILKNLIFFHFIWCWSLHQTTFYGFTLYGNTSSCQIPTHRIQLVEWNNLSNHNIRQVHSFDELGFDELG